MKPIISGERIADYAWLKRGRKYWNLWLGNPFMANLYKIPFEEKTREEIIADVKEMTVTERRRFKADFPDVKWEILR